MILIGLILVSVVFFLLGLWCKYLAEDYKTYRLNKLNSRTTAIRKAFKNLNL